MKARVMCPEHGKLGIEDIVIKDGIPTCSKCSSKLDFGKVSIKKKKSNKK